MIKPIFNASALTRFSSQVLYRPALSLIQGPQPRFASKKKKLPEGTNKANLKQIAQQRERVAVNIKNKRKEQKRMARLRFEAKNSLDSPLYLDVPTALRYLRAAEVGQPANTTTLTLTVRVVADRGVSPLQGSFRLPRSFDSEQVVAVFTTNPELAQQAKDAGANIVGGEELIEQVQNGSIPFTKAFATPEIVPKLASIARVLGPRGLMPNARRGTVTSDIANTLSSSMGLQDFKQGAVPIVSVPIGRVNFSDIDVLNNLLAAIDAIRSAINRIDSKKPIMLGQAVLSSTHGPGIVIEV